ncbi:uncharacterized protein LOC134671989 [Cydia fagiglandana]|uniref:uncharacterized protein LOC134671989 n=1 Tax=Cydia fagiglandana TaxID=1458189 RepID=UPI002FEE472A
MVPLVLLALASAAGASVSELAHRDTGDVFSLTGVECGPTQCAEHGARAADAVCTCACPHRAPLFREDRELCVDDLPECSLASFGTGVGVQRIPFVYLPLKGQIIHPSRDITFQGVKTPICAVSGAQFLTPKGFVDLRNTLDADVPFSLFRDEGRTFLQWSGEDDVRASMSGRMMVVRLLCRDVAAAPASPLDLRGVFTPCVAFRVQGTAPKPLSNVTEVQFAPNAQTSGATATSGLTVTEYVAIGISSLLLGLIYVASVFLYLHIRKRKKGSEATEASSRRLKSLKNKNGSIITERDIVRINNERVQSIPSSLDTDDGVVKNNPLIGMSRSFHQIKHSFPSDSGSTMSDSEDFAESSARSEDHTFNDQTTSALIHSHYSEVKIRNSCSDVTHRDESGIERLPDEHVSIVETTDDREIARPVGTTRRKLYFNPAYFEPHLMAEPPPAALEFLTKIREVIAVAKHKMAAKRFQPVLNEIPEEETYPSHGNSLDIYQGLGSQRSGSVVSLKRENSRKRSINCVGCPGCKTENGSEVHNFIKYDIPACSSCLSSKGEKQNSIRKWLENIPTGKQSFYNDFQPATQNGLVNSLLTLPSAETNCKLRKQNSFTASNPMNLTENITKSRKTSTMSVRSEPPLRTYSYNLPLPEFDKITHNNNRNYYGETISRIDDIRPIGLCDYRTGSLRSNPITNQHRNKFITNKNSLPDMVNEAIALENCGKSYNHNSSDEERVCQKSTNSARKHSESPPINDYETDSLERTSTKKGLATPPEYPDVPSSQASPSLSNALPLEEELTMTNAVYKTHSRSNSNTPSPQRDVCIEQNHYEIIESKKVINNVNNIEANNNSPNNSYSLVSEVYVNNNYNFGSTPTSPSGSDCSMGSRKLRHAGNNSEEKPGCLTIEVKDPPENYIKIHESDGFEPDTLDRKHSKFKQTDENSQFSRKDLIKNIDIDGSPVNQRIQLRSSGTFKKSEAMVSASKFNSLRNDYEYRKNIYERPKLSPTTFNDSKSLDDTSEAWEEVAADWATEEGRILTLELRHSKRQRQCTPPTIKQMKSLARPDILPPLPPTNDHPIYEQPSFPPRRVESARLPQENLSKNLNGRSLSPRTFTKNTTTDLSFRNSNVRKSSIGHPCGPTRASAQMPFSDYENIDTVDACEGAARETEDLCRISNRRRTDRRYSSNPINTNTFVKEPKETSGKTFRMKRKKGQHVEDSGYLSSDSAGSRQVQRKLVIAKIVSCSESDDTENEARSESGAESVETHSVYFDSYRKQEVNVVESDSKMLTYDKSARSSGRRFRNNLQ